MHCTVIVLAVAVNGRVIQTVVINGENVWVKTSSEMMEICKDMATR
jgi:hypothetical protein